MVGYKEQGTENLCLKGKGREWVYVHILCHKLLPIPWKKREKRKQANPERLILL
jgi:hypothetical protein